MTRRTRVGRSVSVVLLVCAASFTGNAQQAGDSDSPFCALTGADLLAALDGSWTIYQGAGTAQGGPMVIPLPPPAPAPVTFKYDPERGVVDVESANQPDGMIMFNTPPTNQAQAVRLIGGQPEASESESACDWSSLPTLVGTNVYFMVGQEHFSKYLDEKRLQDVCDEARYRANIELSEEQLARLPKEDAKEDEGVTHYREYLKRNVQSLQDHIDKYCGEQPEPALEGTFDMEMTLVLRFSSTNSGSGMVYFEGKTDKSRFKASAPVTISR